jgi:hypothetical protein
MTYRECSEWLRQYLSEAHTVPIKQPSGLANLKAAPGSRRRPCLKSPSLGFILVPARWVAMQESCLFRTADCDIWRWELQQIVRSIAENVTWCRDFDATRPALQACAFNHSASWPPLRECLQVAATQGPGKAPPSQESFLL